MQLKRGVALTLLYTIGFLASGAILTGKSTGPEVVRRDVRAEQAAVIPPYATEALGGRLAIVNMRHWSVSRQGLAYDQVRRGLWMVMFLLCYRLQKKCPSARLRRAMEITALVGAAGYLSDVLSYWLLGGVADWIGVNGHIALSPTDLSAYGCPAALMILSAWGLMANVAAASKRLGSAASVPCSPDPEAA